MLQLASDDDAEVRRILAKADELTKAVVLKLMPDTDPGVRENLKYNDAPLVQNVLKEQGR